ncbi:MAG: hypothetical protein AAGA00_06385 [Pseudomonadota bacterium]
MKKLIASSVVAVALAISATSAQAVDYEAQVQELVVSGMVESWVGYTVYGSTDNLDDGENLEDYFAGGRSGRLSLPLGENLSIQMDIDNETNSDFLVNGSDDVNFQYSFQGLVHLSWRDPNSGLIGAFGGMGLGASADSADGTDDRFPLRVIGGEAQLYADDFTFYVQGGWLDSVPDGTEDDGFRDAFFGRGVVRWFLHENSRLQGEVSYAEGKVDGDNDDNEYLIEWGARFDTRLGSLPILGDTNAFIGYRGGYFENESDNDGDGEYFTDHTFMIGLRASFGGATLKQFDRVGATLDAPNFGRWVASGSIVD